MNHLIPCLALFSASSVALPAPDCNAPDTSPPNECTTLESLNIFGSANQATEVAGGANRITPGELLQFESTDVVRALRRVPGVSLQQEDGFGLRPNIGIRGTATDRSSRITLLEDGVLIAPAPYSAAAAYYFPTFGRIRSVEVLKGPSAVTEGPYTVGGAINLQATPIPVAASGLLKGEYGSDTTWRIHGWYGDRGERFGFLAETHQWQSEGYQQIDRSHADTGLEMQDYLARLAVYSDPAASIEQGLEIKLQSSEENSRQSYLGLTDGDFSTDPLRRYGLSGLDDMQTEHSQAMLNWSLLLPSGTGVSLIAYDNDFERAWYKTEGIDFDGTSSPQSFSLTGWADVIAAINTGTGLGGISAPQLEAILDGADTAPGSFQIRNNAREYESRGVQLRADRAFRWGETSHEVVGGIRYHEDEEDRLQRNDSYQQQGGQLILTATGLEGNAGNQVQGASAWAAFAQDRIDYGPWTFSPGVRFESMELSRTRWRTNSADPASREPSNFADYRENREEVWLPGLGLLYRLGDSSRLVAGVHKGFAAPGNAPDSRPEESINYELGLRHAAGNLEFEVLGFFQDYGNLVGVCTNSTGGNCEPGDVFNGDAVHVPGVEISLRSSVEPGSSWQLPLQFAYTWMDAEFQSDFSSQFFGEVSAGDAVPYIPGHQAWASAGLEHGPWSLYLSGNYLDSVCTQAACSRFERTDSTLVFDFAVHYALGRGVDLFGVVENLSDELDIVGREPYGARPGKPRTFMVGVAFGF